MTTPAHVPRGTESDSLLVQVHVGNVLQVRNVFLKEERDIASVLRRARRELTLRPCGTDPVSDDVTPMFQAKIDHIVETHWAHVRELHESTERLREAALDYGFTDDEIDRSFATYDAGVSGRTVDR